MSASRGDILIVDDQPANLALLSQVLTRSDYQVRTVTDGEHAIAEALERRPDCILLDINLSGMDGLRTCEVLRATPTLHDVPVLFLTAHDDLAHKLGSFRVGGSDYITKPFQLEEVMARVHHQVRLAHLERELRARNEELAKVNAELLAAARLKADLTAMLVHDLRSPLTVIGLALERPDEQALEDAREAHARLVKLTANMLELARAAHTEKQRVLEPVDLGGLLSRVGRQSQSLAAQKAVTVLVKPLAHLEVSGDEGQLERAFSNLMDNALKFTPPKGLVTVSLRTELGEGVESGLRFAAARVQDTGLGIPPEDLPFVFDPYHQASSGREQGGFGLCLAIVARIVAEHGGRIRTHSQVGVGTEFRVLLPLRATPPPG